MMCHPVCMTRNGPFQMSLVTVRRRGGFVPSPLTELVNNHLYDGKENDILYWGKYTTQFICSFNMQFYPFDIQECHMEFMFSVCHKL